MVFAGNHVNTKVVVNLLNKLVLKFGGIWPSSLGDGCSQFESSFDCSLYCEDRFLLLSDFDKVKVGIMP